MNISDVPVRATDHTVDAPPPEPRSGEIVLTNEERLSIELIITRKRLADAEMKLALVAMKDAQRKLVSYSRDEAVIMIRIQHQHGLENIKSLKLADGKIVYELG